MNLNSKLVILFLCIALIPIMILEGISITEISDDLVNQKESALDSSLISKISDIEHYFDTRQTQTKLFATTFFPLQLDSNNINQPQTLDKIQIHIDAMLVETRSNSLDNFEDDTSRSSIEAIFISDVDGNILASTQREFIGHKLPSDLMNDADQSKYFFGGLQKNRIFSHNYITFAEDLKDTNGNDYGRILLQTPLNLIDPQDLSKGLNNDHEIFLVDSVSRQVTSDSSVKYSTQNWNNEYNQIDKCFAGQSISEQYINKDGKEVLGILKLLEDGNLCIVGEIELEKVFSPIYDLQFKLLSVFSMLLVGIVLLAIFFSRTISSPIKKLSTTMNEIRKGNFNVKLDKKPESSNNELDQLTNGFEKLLHYVKSTQDNLKGLVKVQTKKLEDSNTALVENMNLIKKQQEDLSNFKEALDKSANVLITDTTGSIIYVNDDFCKVSKFSREELLGQNPRIVSSYHHDKEFFKNMWETISSGKAWKGDIKNKAKDGSYYWSKATISPLLGDDGKPEQYIAILTDITNQKILEEKLSEALKNVKESELRKEEFSSMMTHELNTPLVPIKGYCEMLKDTDTFGTLNDDQLDFIGKIESNATLLERLISDLLDVQKLDMKKMTFVITEFSLDEFMNELEENSKHLMKNKEINFTVKCPKNLILKSDRHRLRQVLDNLIRNSVDFVPEKDGKILVEAKIKENNVIFSVCDNGPGIPKEKQSNIFKKFYQIDTSHTRKHGGTGLGLVICKGIAEGLEGKIWLESEFGKGTSFFICLPAPDKQVILNKMA
ncbi:MAG: PAS domain S-box protein [Nitrosopumilaceae archaeon]|uniref:PAS domain S-box protein n=1 Tax=Candidatus Nitrosomaritimum aestuariumsis TaxID=3342354 RepID=A0AC60W9R2_9ARCH|nr:PAS domain S-box protein [Nitrosopumilaceae archaeon]MBA4463773.1 PAS domain S-box protein [Nitrosopumilaceae archaeon]NCF22452.1 PAS domain S-box protein [Nitrosopumilaceae archaeon]